MNTLREQTIEQIAHYLIDNIPIAPYQSLSTDSKKQIDNAFKTLTINLLNAITKLAIVDKTEYPPYTNNHAIKHYVEELIKNGWVKEVKE
jgi:hypothetical protein